MSHQVLNDMVNASDFLAAFGLGGSGQISAHSASASASASAASAEAQVADKEAMRAAFAELMGASGAVEQLQDIAGLTDISATNASFPALNPAGFAAQVASIRPYLGEADSAALPSGTGNMAQMALAQITADMSLSAVSGQSAQAPIADMLQGLPLLSGPLATQGQTPAINLSTGMDIEALAQHMRTLGTADIAAIADIAPSATAQPHIISQIAEANGLGSATEPTAADLRQLASSSDLTVAERIAAGDALISSEADTEAAATNATPTATLTPAQQATAAAATSEAQAEISKKLGDQITLDTNPQDTAQDVAQAAANTAQNNRKAGQQASGYQPQTDTSSYRPATMQAQDNFQAATSTAQQPTPSRGEIHAVAAAQQAANRRPTTKHADQPDTSTERPTADDFRLRTLPDLTPRDGRGLPQWAQAGAPASLESLLGYRGFETALSAPLAYGADGTIGGERSLLAQTNTPLAAHQASGQVEMAIKKAVKGNINAFTVRLDPAELGRITVKMNFAADGSASAEILASRPETLQMLQQESRSLERALAANGHDVDSGAISFDLDQQQDGQSAGRAFAEAMQEDKAADQQNAVSSSVSDDQATEANTGELIWRGPEDLTDPISLETILAQASRETGLDVRI